jgi:hypothetical protein
MVQSGERGGPVGAGDRPAGPDPDRLQRPPEDLRRTTREALTTRAPNTDVADVVYDSLIDVPGEERARDGGRELRFERGEISVSLEVVEDAARPGTCLVTLLLTPARSVKVEMRGGNAPVSVDVNAGRAVFELQARRLVTIVVPPTEPGMRGVQTAWVRL